MTAKVSVDDFQTGDMPVGEWVYLDPGVSYFIVAQAHGIIMGAKARAGKLGLPPLFQFVPTMGVYYEVKGSDWESLIVFDTSQGQNSGLTSTNVVIQSSTSFQGTRGLNAPAIGQAFNAQAAQRAYSLVRYLELSAVIGGNNSAVFTGTIASGGASIAGTYSNKQFSLLTLVYKIGGADGTAPLSASITFKDSGTNTVLFVFGQTSGSVKVRVNSGGTCNYTFANSDSVSHTFSLQIYEESV